MIFSKKNLIIFKNDINFYPNVSSFSDVCWICWFSLKIVDIPSLFSCLTGYLPTFRNILEFGGFLVTIRIQKSGVTLIWRERIPHPCYTLATIGPIAQECLFWGSAWMNTFTIVHFLIWKFYSSFMRNQKKTEISRELAKQSLMVFYSQRTSLDYFLRKD